MTVWCRTVRRNFPKRVDTTAEPTLLYCCLHFEFIVTLLTKQSISKLITSNELLRLSN